MWIVHNFGDMNDRYKKFLQNGKPRFQKFLDSLLLYDEVVIPTDDFLSVAALVGVLGPHPVLSLAESGSLQIVRVKGFLSYVGNGGGLIGASVFRPGRGHLPVSASMDNALHEVLSGLDNVDAAMATRLTDAVVPLTIEKAASVEDKIIREEIYRDISQSETLRAVFDNHDLSLLPGIEPAGVRTFDAQAAPPDREDKIALLLRLAQSILEMQLASYSNCRDIASGNPVGQLLRAKQDAKSLHSGYLSLQEIADIPQTVDWILAAPDGINRIIKMRETAAGRAFRKWMRETPDGEIAKAYVSLLRSEPNTSSLPVRALRFLVASGWSAVEPITGTIAGVIDGFVADNFLARRSPRFFIDQLGKLPR